MLDTHFGWSGGKPFEQMTPNEKSEAIGRLAGGTLGAIVGGLGMGELVGFVPKSPTARGGAKGAPEESPGPKPEESGGKPTEEGNGKGGAGKPIESKLGPDVDGRVNQSPSLQDDWQGLSDDGWVMEDGTPGEGSRCDPRNKKITLDPNAANNPDGGASTVAHEIGHAKSPGPKVPDPRNAADRATFVDEATNESLTEEGRATLKNAQARQEILDNGGPDIGYPGDPANTAAYDGIAQRVNNGELTPEQGAQEIGKIYGDGEKVSGTNPPQTYNEWLRDQYGDYYDKSNP